MREKIIEHYADSEDVLFADGLDDAIIGFDSNLWKVVYSRNLCVNILVGRDDIDEEEAMEFLEYNTFNAYLGEKTPVWVEDFKW